MAVPYMNQNHIFAMIMAANVVAPNSARPSAGTVLATKVP